MGRTCSTLRLRQRAATVLLLLALLSVAVEAFRTTTATSVVPSSSLRLQPLRALGNNKFSAAPLLLAAGLFTSTVSPDLCLAAQRTNPEAIDIRRVEQQPPGAPAPEKAKTQTLPNGVQYFDVTVGDGLAAEEGRSVQFQWVLRRANGYFIDATSNYNDEPFIYKVGNLKKVIPGLDAGIRGMKAGGVRRIVIPSELAYTAGVDDSSPGPVPAGFGPRRQLINIMNVKQTVYFEIKLVKVK